MRFIFSVCLFSFFVFSCTLQKNKLPDFIKVWGDTIQIDIKTNRSNISHPILSIDSVFVELPGFSINSQPLFSLKDSLILLATSKSDNAYVIDLSSFHKIREYKMKPTIKINKSDTQGSNCALDLSIDLHALDFYTNEDIILQIENKLIMINSQGDITDSVIFNDNKLWYSNLYDVPVEYNPVTKKIYVYKYCYACKQQSAAYYSYSVESSIDIITKKIEEENIKFPEIYNHFGLLAMESVSRTSFNNYQYFTFFPDHRIYEYNVLDKKNTVYGGQSAYSTGKIRTVNKKETDFDAMLSQMVYTDLYLKLVYDDINRRYYRLFLHPAMVNPVNGHIKYDFYIQIFSKDFSLEDEIKFDRLGPNYFSYGGKLYWIVLKPNGAMFYGYTFS